MFKNYSALLCLLIISCHTWSQVFPKENSKLSYVLVGFTFPAVPQASEYELEIAEGNYDADQPFKKNIVSTTTGKQNKLIAQVPSFGKNYTWRVTANVNGAPAPGDMHHFNTLMIDDVNPDSMRMRIEKSAEKYEDAYFFCDINRTLYDMKGQPVWFIPQTDNLNFEIRQVRDLKVSNRNTITFLIGGKDAYEINYNGDILWKAPKTRFQGYLREDTTERYNHEMTRLSNGYYMVLGSEFVWSDPNVKAPKFGEKPPEPKPGTPVGRSVLYGTITEFDDKGKTIWNWRSAPYFQHEDIGADPIDMLRIMHDVHQNSFAFDERNKMVYLSYKNIHRILKVKYPEGKVVGNYGELYKHGEPDNPNKLFCYIHSVKLSDKGYLYLFNNNSCHQDHGPQIQMFQEPKSKNGPLSLIWQYEFPVQPLADVIKDMKLAPNQPAGAVGKGDETVGGNAIELPDGSMFASLCSPYGDLFIVDKNKNVLWHAINEKWSTRENKWAHINTYRASIVLTRQELESIIMNSLPNQ